MGNCYQYFVEGECEEKLITEGKKSPYFLFRPGKVEVLNVASKELSEARILAIKKNTQIILIYDIDKGNLEILKNNVKKLQLYGFKKIYHIQSIINFEEELLYCTNLKSIDEMFGTVGLTNFKQKFINHKNIISKLQSVGFDKNKIWSRKTKGSFSIYFNENDQKFIKKG